MTNERCSDVDFGTSARADRSPAVGLTPPALVPVKKHVTNSQIDFELLNDRALQAIDLVLEDFLGLEVKLVGDEVEMLNPHRSDIDFGSFKINSKTGRWADFALGSEASGGDVISLTKYVKKLPDQVTAAKALGAFLDNLEVDPAPNPARRMDGTSIPFVDSKSERHSRGGQTVAATRPVSATRREPTAAETLSPARQDEQIPQFSPVRPGYGKPASAYDYLDKLGRPVARVLRYENATSKTFALASLTRSDAGKLTWIAAAPEPPRPLFNRYLLELRIGDAVIICEGEKASLAAAKLLPRMVAATTMGGAKAAEKTDFRPLAGRRVYIAPDKDQAGESYKDTILKQLLKVGASVQGVIRYKEEHFGRVIDGVRQGVPEKFDLADALEDGFTSEMMAQVFDDLVELVRADAIDAVASRGAERKQPAVAELADVPIAELATRFVATYFDGLLQHDGSSFRTYRGGHWPIVDTRVEIKQALSLFLGPTAGPKRINELVEMLSIVTACKTDEFGRPKPKICLLNGTLDPLSGFLAHHRPEDSLPNRLELNWNPSAACPLWLQTIDEIFAPDLDKEDKIRFLQEFIGYCLVPDTRMHKFVWMIGRGGNGKSLVLDVINELVGPSNVSHASLERIQDKVVRAELQGKLVNISSEMSAKATISDGYLKQIVSGETLEAERKYQPSFSFKPTVRLIGATNELPRLLDHSDGFFRRAVILPFNRRFTEAEQDKDRAGRLKLELEGILAWAVQGLQSLLARGRFSIPRSSDEALRQYRLDSDPVEQFASEYLVATADRTLWVKAEPLYQAFRQWAHDSGYALLSMSSFKQRLAGKGFLQTRQNNGRFWQAEFKDHH